MSKPSIDIQLKLTGFQKLRRVLDPARFDRALTRYLRTENGISGRYGKKLIKQSIRKQQWAPNSAWQKAAKGHGVTLIHHELLYRSTAYTIVPGGFIIGVQRTSNDQKYNVARIVHDGAMLKHPQTKKLLILPARPYFAKALFDKEIKTTEMATAGIKTNSPFIIAVRAGWMYAIHLAFTEKNTPNSSTPPSTPKT